MITITITITVDGEAQTQTQRPAPGCWSFEGVGEAMLMLKSLDRIASERGEVLPRQVVVEVWEEWIGLVREACWEAGCGDWITHRLKAVPGPVVWPEGVEGLHIHQELNWGWR